MVVTRIILVLDIGLLINDFHWVINHHKHLILKITKAHGMENKIEIESEIAASVQNRLGFADGLQTKPVLIIILVQSCPFQLTGRSSLGINSQKLICGMESFKCSARARIF